jgi:hypothetical protein
MKKVRLITFAGLILAGVFYSCNRENVNPVAECRKAPDIYVKEINDGGASVEMVLESGANFWTAAPSYVVWAKYNDGTEESIYVTCKASKGYWEDYGSQEDGLPVWYRIRSEAGYIKDDPRLDAITTATPTRSTFTIHWEPLPELRTDTIMIFVEANLPYDFNDSYPQSKGDNGQPSIIWMSRFYFSDGQLLELQPFRIVGRGHPLGLDSKIYADLNGITTAGQIFRRITLGAVE